MRQGSTLSPSNCLLLGASGFLGRAIAAELNRQDVAFAGTWCSPRPDPEVSGFQYRFLGDELSLDLMAAAPDCLIIAARLADPAATGRCTQAEFEAGFRALIAAFLKPGHRDVPCKIVYVSSDAVFRGDKGPYRETDSPDATSDYGLRHRRAEEILMEEHESALIVRPSYLFDGTPDALDKRLARLKRILSAGRSLELATNIHKSPAPVSDAARQIIDGAFSGRTGIMHVAAPRMSLYEFYAHGLELLGLQEFAAKLVPVTDQKPNDTSLVSSLTELTV